ncbi:MAG TPA: polymer-forming cytoskeletal protein, partial [Dongiaceae bacterium]|nr:polymer-forming cytoskeletal protein [Dongiaceae bacterium]
KGQIKADSVVLEKTAKVTGDVLHKTLAIEQGAQLEGMCKRLEAPAGAQVALPAPTPANETKPLTNGDAKPLADRLAAIR